MTESEDEDLENALTVMLGTENHNDSHHLLPHPRPRTLLRGQQVEVPLITERLWRCTVATK
jgi:hypothetical protein